MEAFLWQKQKQQECTVPISQLSASSSGAPCSSALARFSVEPEGAQLRFHHESEAGDVIQVDIPTAQEEELYEIEIPLSFKASVDSRIHGLACWFDALFDGRKTICSINIIFCLHKDALLLLLVHLEPTGTSFRMFFLSQYVMAGQEITGRLHMVAHNAQSYTMYLTMSAKMWGAGAEQGVLLQT